MAHIDVLADDRGLSTCFRGAQIKEEWANLYLAHHHIGTLDDFVYTVTGHEWEKSLESLVFAVTGLQQNRIALARFKSAYECGVQALKQAAQSAPKSEDLDAVLPDGQLQQLQNDWLKRYSLQFESFLEPSEQLRSRIYREFKGQKLTVLEIRKVKSVLNLATPRAQEQVQLPGGVQLHFDRDVGISLKSVLEYYQQLRVLMHAWAWAGNYFVKYNQDQILMMDLTTSLSYADRCLKDVLEFGGGSLRWLERNDVLTRGKMSTYVRRGFPASVALVEALRETHIEWRSPVVSAGFDTP